MKHLLSQLKLVLVLIFLATAVSFAYVPPAAGPTSNNNEIEPLNEGVTAQAKVGGLSVEAFQAQGNAWFKDDVAMGGALLGGTPLVTGSLYVGDNTRTVAAAVNGSVFTGGTISSPSLKPGTSSSGKLCADANGVFIPCVTPPVVNTPQYKVVLETYIDDLGDDGYGAPISLEQLRRTRFRPISVELFSVENATNAPMPIEIKHDFTLFESYRNIGAKNRQEVLISEPGVYEISGIYFDSCTYQAVTTSEVGAQFVLDENNPQFSLRFECQLLDSVNMK